MKMGSGEFHGFRKSSHTGQEVWGYCRRSLRDTPGQWLEQVCKFFFKAEILVALDLWSAVSPTSSRRTPERGDARTARSACRLEACDTADQRSALRFRVGGVCRFDRRLSLGQLKLFGASDRFPTRFAHHHLVRGDGRDGISGGTLDRQPAGSEQRDCRREDPRFGALADCGDYYRRARALCHLLLARTIRRATDHRDLHGLARRPGLLRRPDWRHAGRHSLCPETYPAGLETSRRHRAEYRSGFSFWKDRLPYEWLLLRTRMQPALGHSFSARAPNLPARRSPHRGL